MNLSASLIHLSSILATPWSNCWKQMVIAKKNY